MKPREKLTPGQAAKIIAKDRGDAVPQAMIKVYSVQDKNPYGIKDKIGTFYKVGSEVKQTRKDGIDRASNGLCWFCGNLFLDSVVRVYDVMDSRAGEIMTEEDRKEAGFAFVNVGWRYGIANWAYTHACENCARENNLNWSMTRLPFVKDQENKIEFIRRNLGKYKDQPEVVMRVYIKDWQGGHSDSITLVERYRDDSRELRIKMEIPRKEVEHGLQ